MPWTLYRYMLKELLKILVMTTLVLVLIMSVAAAIKPLSDGLLGPVSLMKFVFFMAPTMLSIALPFAGAFAGSLVFHRMTAENEILVCRASGINYLLIMLPVVFLGIALMLGMFYLSNWLIPRFYERAEHTLQKDVVSGVRRKVNQGEPIHHGSLILYADGAAEGEPPPMKSERGIEPKRLLALTGVAVGRLDDEGRVRADGTAERADMLLYSIDDQSWITLRLKNVRFFDEEARSQRAVTEDLSLPPYRIENPFRQRLKFLSLPQLRRMKWTPEEYGSVAHAKNALINALAREQLIRAMLRDADPPSGEGRLVLESSVRGERYIIRMPVVKRTDDGLSFEADEDAWVEIDRYAHGVIAERRFRARHATVEVEFGHGTEPRLEIRLYDLRVVNTHEGGRSTQHPTRTMPLTRWSKDIARPLHETPLRTLMQVAKRDFADVPAVTDAVGIADARIDELMRKSMAEFHERISLAVGTLLMIVLGSVLAMKLQDRLALVVYFWAFVLATMSVIITNGGAKVLEEFSAFSFMGLLTLWSGNLIVFGAVLITYWKLEKN